MLRLIFVAGLALSCFANAEVIRLSNPVAQTEQSETFGEVFDTSANAVSLGDVMSDTDEFSDKPFLLKTEIAKVCQKKGCFFIAREAGHAVRVSFKDYGFFIPTDSGGKTVLLAGEIVKKEDGITLHTNGGNIHPLKAQGWTHFESNQ